MGYAGLQYLNPLFSGGKRYLLREDFPGAVAAGAINGTPTAPGPGGIRVVTDTGNNLSIGGGVLNVAGGTGVWGQTTFSWSTGITRPAGYDAGYVLEFDIVADVDKDIWVGSCTDTAPGSYLGADCEHGLLFASDGNLDVVAAGAIVKANAVALSNGTTYRVRFILYSSGCFYSISGGAFGTLGVTYTALHETISQVTATLYAAISNLDAVTTIDRVQTEAQLYAVTFANYVTDVPYAEAYQLRLLFRLTAGNAWTNKTNWLSTTTAANWFRITVAGGRTTKIELYANNLIGNIATWSFNTFTALVTLSLWGNLISGSISGWILPASLTYLEIRSTSLSGNISGWVLPASLGTLRLQSTSVTGSVAGWVLPATLITFQIGVTALSGNISGWVLPAGLANIQLQSTSVTGSVATWVIPAGMQYCYIYSITLTNSPIFTSAVALLSFLYHNCALPQATVDLIVSRIYARRMSFTNAAPTAEVGGTNDAPSGIYADEDPPVTGKGFIYELVNDPEVEGFNKWAITYTP